MMLSYGIAYALRDVRYFTISYLFFSAISTVVVIFIAIFVSSVILLIGIICIKW